MSLYWAATDMVCWSNVSIVFRLVTVLLVRERGLTGLRNLIGRLLVRYGAGQRPFVSSSEWLSSPFLNSLIRRRGNNVITVLMKEKQIDLQTASDEVGEHFGRLMKRFTADKASLPSWGPSVDSLVAGYVKALGHWVSGNLRWSFETQRYFGVNHRRIKKTRLIILRHTNCCGQEEPQ